MNFAQIIKYSYPSLFSVSCVSLSTLIYEFAQFVKEKPEYIPLRIGLKVAYKVINGDY